MQITVHILLLALKQSSGAPHHGFPKREQYWDAT